MLAQFCLELLEDVTFSVINEILFIVFYHNGLLRSSYFAIVNVTKDAITKLSFGLHKFIQLLFIGNILY